MTDQWDGWPEDDLPDADTADLGDAGGFGEPGLPEPDFTADAGPDDHGPDDFGLDDSGGDQGEPAAAGLQAPLGYGDESLDADAALEPADLPGEVLDGDTANTADLGGGPADPPVGADPDLSLDDPAGEPVFPAALELAEPPEPVDGFPWADAGLLGDAAGPLPDPLAGVRGTPPPDELYAYTGEQPPAGQPGWAGLIGSPDPATSALARFWSAG